MHYMRGHRSVYLSLFNEEIITPLPVALRRGRSELLLQKRNEKLAHRYWWLVKIKGKQYHVALNDLEQEFDIAAFTIAKRLCESECTSILKTLNTDKPASAFFKTKYPYLNWQ